MCLINDPQIAGKQWDANGDPSKIVVDVRAQGCDYLEFKVFRTQGDAVPLYSATNRPVSGGLADAPFTITKDKVVHCGEVLWVEVVCQTDPSCLMREEVRVNCKGFESAAECPGAGPALSIQPAVDISADCIAGGTYTITIGGTWPAGSTFNWSLGNLPPGITSPTNQHGASFVLQHPVGSPGRILIAEVEVPGCPDVQSVVVFPSADTENCPSQIGLSVFGPAGLVPVPADGTTYAGLPPGNYRVEVSSPAAGPGVDFEWYRDNALQSSTPATPNELEVPSLPAGAETTIAVRVQQECCNALLDTVVLRTAPAKGGGPDDTPPRDSDDDDDTTQTPDDVTPPSWPCVILGLLVGLAMIAALVSLVGLAVPPVAILALPVRLTAAIAILIAGVLLLLICRPSLCRLLGIVAWALKWAILLGVLIAIATLSLGAFLLVLVYGMLLAAAVWLIALNGCQEPGMFSTP
jgi:hypothetical protein